MTSYANGTTATATADGDSNEVGLSATSPGLGISYTRNADEDVTGETTSVSGTTWYTLGDGYDADTQVTSTSAKGSPTMLAPSDTTRPGIRPRRLARPPAHRSRRVSIQLKS